MTTYTLKLDTAQLQSLRFAVQVGKDECSRGGIGADIHRSLREVEAKITEAKPDNEPTAETFLCPMCHRDKSDGACNRSYCPLSD